MNEPIFDRNDPAFNLLDTWSPPEDQESEAEPIHRDIASVWRGFYAQFFFSEDQRKAEQEDNTTT